MARAKKTKKTTKPIDVAEAPALSSVPNPPQKHAGGRPLLFKSSEELQSAIDSYFDSCWEEVWHYRMKPQYARMKISTLEKLGIPREEQFEWMPELDRERRIVRHQVKPYTITALANHLGTSRETLLDYQDRDEFSDTIKSAKVKIHAYTEEQLFQPKIAAGVIFNLKNNYGYKDRMDMTTDDKPLPPGVQITNVKQLSDDELTKLADAGQGGISA